MYAVVFAKVFVDNGGLRAHQKYCKIFASLSSAYNYGNNHHEINTLMGDDLVSSDSTDVGLVPSDSTDAASDELPDFHSLDGNNTAENSSSNAKFKAGIRLPKSKEDWSLANAYIQTIAASIDFSLLSENLGSYVLNIQNQIYEYFESTFGCVQEVSHEFDEKYINMSVKSLKSALKQFKRNNADLEEIQYLSRLIRSRLNKQKEFRNDRRVLEKNLNNKFWPTCRDLFNKAMNTVPTFAMSV